MSHKCEHCGKPATGSINGRHFCTSKACVGAAVNSAFKVVKIITANSARVTLSRK